MQPGAAVVLRPSPWKWLGVGAVCLLFMIGGAWMVRQGEWIGWLCLAFFGAGLLVSAISLLSNANYLRLDSDGFTMCSLYRAHTYRWADVTGFGVGRILTNKMVMFNFDPTYERTPGLRSFNVNLVGYEAGLPDSYGLTHEALADLLNEYKNASREA